MKPRSPLIPDMAECLVIARKVRDGCKRALFATLGRRPSSQLEGMLIANQISRCWEAANVRKLEDGPIGGETIRVGDDVLGSILDAPLPNAEPWPISRISDVAIAQSVFQLVANNRLWLPASSETNAIKVPICKLSALAKVGPLHRDINGTEQAGSVIRGPFDIEPIPQGHHPTYPTLWSHEADNE